MKIKFDLLKWYSIIRFAVTLLPLVIIFLSAFSEASSISFPPKGFSLKWFAVALSDGSLMDSIQTSLLLAIVASILSVLAGTLASYALVRYRFPGRNVVDSLITAPLTLPMVGLGLGLLFFFSSFMGGLSFINLVFGHVIITLPYVVRNVSISLAAVDKSLERSAMILGAGPITTFYKITLPLIKPGLISGTLMAFIASFNNTTISLFVSNPENLTFPVKIFYFIEFFPDPRMFAISSFVIIASLAIMLVLDRVFGLYKIAIR